MIRQIFRAKTTIMFAICLLPLLVGTTWIYAQEQDPSMIKTDSEVLELLLTPEKDSFTIRESIKIRVVCKNVGVTDLSIPQVSPEFDYNVTVRDPQGEIIPLSDEGKQIKNRSVFRRTYTIIEPGELIVEEINLDQLFNLPASGEYQVTVSRPYDMKSHSTNSNFLRAKATSDQVSVRLQN